MSVIKTWNINFFLFYYFSVNVIELDSFICVPLFFIAFIRKLTQMLEFQATGFLASHFFIAYVQKLNQILLLTLFFQIMINLTEKLQKQFKLQFNNKNKNSYKFCAFMIKTDFRNMSENTEFRLKDRAKPSQSAHFTTIFSKSTEFIKKK